MSAVQPTGEQLAALRSFAAANGRTWKSKLLHSWETGDTHGQWTAPLRQVRNTFGPSWLVRFKLPAAAAAAPAISGEAFSGPTAKSSASLVSWKRWHSGYANTPFVIYEGETAPDINRDNPVAGVDVVCEVRHDESPQHRQQIARGRLLTAAPEMAQALRDLQAAFRTCIGAAAFWEFEQSNPAVRAAMRALAKAGL